MKGRLPEGGKRQNDDQSGHQIGRGGGKRGRIGGQGGGNCVEKESIKIMTTLPMDRRRKGELGVSQDARRRAQKMITARVQIKKKGLCRGRIQSNSEHARKGRGTVGYLYSSFLHARVSDRGGELEKKARRPGQLRRGTDPQ